MMRVLVRLARPRIAIEPDRRLGAERQTLVLVRI